MRIVFASLAVAACLYPGFAAAQPNRQGQIVQDYIKQSTDLYFGTGNAAPAGGGTTGPAPAAPASNMAKVTGDVDLYDAPGGSGSVIGMLNAGSSVPLMQCRGDNWCQVQGGWVWGDFLSR
ncbi:SH3 domain-containing protein [Devosia sediminis]|uniref:SH3 domain-containing protein n=1 Tax=Devosia sediminis TaxID=2798801 RepID=A0A934J007_9HYPH|nr:SH3 domain-containing protein [Devosia sediminis]MBJ3786250.1 SH3 domain-containing protein [Devosia sediminis]